MCWRLEIQAFLKIIKLFMLKTTNLRRVEVPLLKVLQQHRGTGA